MSLSIAKLQDTKSKHRKSILVLYINSEQLNIKIKNKSIINYSSIKKYKIIRHKFKKMRARLVP